MGVIFRINLRSSALIFTIIGAIYNYDAIRGLRRKLIKTSLVQGSWH